MAINIIMLLNNIAVEQAHKDQVELTVGKQRSSTHAVAETISEQGRIGLLKPSLRPEDFRVFPDSLVCYDY